MKLVAGIAVSMANAGDIAWWAMSVDWESAQIFYKFKAMLLGGSVVANVVRADA